MEDKIQEILEKLMECRMTSREAKEQILALFSVSESLTPHCCPVCGGRGMVHCGFYSQYNGSTISTAPNCVRRAKLLALFGVNVC